MNQSRTTEAAHGAAASRYVMLIEDEDHIREALTDVLETKGFGVLACLDCAAALEALRAGARPDVVLLDLITPRMTGWEFRVEQRKHPDWSSIPTVALTACTSAEAAAIDADVVLTKPVEERTLLDTIRGLLDERDRSRIEARLRERERLGSLGALASGIAHEVNNPLTAVVGNLDLAQRRLTTLVARAPTDADVAQAVTAVQAMLSKAEASAQRVAEIVRRMAQFAKPPSGDRVRLNVTELVESSLQFVENELRHRGRLERDFAPAPDVEASPAQLGQVFLNLLVNALFSLDDRSGDQAVVRVRIAEEEGQASVTVSHPVGARVARAIAALFGPSDTFKGAVGFGDTLSVSRRCVEEFGGTLSALAGEDGILSLRVRLPAAGAALSAEKEAAKERESTVPAYPAEVPSGRVLVIDDEPMVCELMRAILETKHEVTTLMSGTEALALLRAGERYDAIVCDVMMPGMTGIDLYETLSRDLPEQASKVIFVSGGTFTQRARDFFEQPRMRYLAKPFEATELLRVVAARVALSQVAVGETRAS